MGSGYGKARRVRGILPKRKPLSNPQVYKDGTQKWFKDLGHDETFHRVDGPAVVRPDGLSKWYFDGKLHRVDGPAVERENGVREWYINGKYHRVDGPAVERARSEERRGGNRRGTNHLP